MLVNVYIGCCAFFPQREEIIFEFSREKMGCATNDMDQDLNRHLHRYVNFDTIIRIFEQF